MRVLAQHLHGERFIRVAAEGPVLAEQRRGAIDIAVYTSQKRSSGFVGTASARSEARNSSLDMTRF